jgi:hypothetical protein
MRCSAISAITRVFDALWRCAASGIAPGSASVTIPGLQRTVSRCAAPGKRVFTRPVGLDIDRASRKLDLSKVETIALPPASAAE